jgi:hypothetical protein
MHFISATFSPFEFKTVPFMSSGLPFAATALNAFYY